MYLSLFSLQLQWMSDWNKDVICKYISIIYFKCAIFKIAMPDFNDWTILFSWSISVYQLMRLNDVFKFNSLNSSLFLTQSYHMTFNITYKSYGLHLGYLIVLVCPFWSMKASFSIHCNARKKWPTYLYLYAQKCHS